MPFYEFKCQHCGHVFEKKLSYSDSLPTVCPNVLEVTHDRRGESLVVCNGPIEQVYRPTPVHYKVGGFAVNTSRWMDEDTSSYDDYS